MKRLFSSKREHVLARVCVLLIIAAFITGTVGCTEVPVVTLTITSTEGGSVTTPGEGTFTYNGGTVVDLAAKHDEDYQFINWTGDVSSVADVHDATTTITMNDHYSITANYAVPIEIWDWYDLDAIRYDLGGSYILMNDLDSNTEGYKELASVSYTHWQPIQNFTGSFDGQGYAIAGLYVSSSENNVGLFGHVGSGGIIEDVGLVDVHVRGWYRIGGLVGFNMGTVIDCYCTGSISRHSSDPIIIIKPTHVGGLVGENYHGTVSNSYSTGSISGNVRVGGLVGYNTRGTVTNSYSAATTSGYEHVGGLVGENYHSTVSNSYSTGSVSGNSSVGGLFGDNNGTVSNSFWDTETSGQATSDGGTGKTTAEMQDITTFSGASWDIIGVADPGTRNPLYAWNIVDAVTYPFLSWQP